MKLDIQLENVELPTYLLTTKAEKVEVVSEV